MNTFNIFTIIVGLLTILVNVWLVRYNAGLNRLIYGIEEAIIDRTKSGCFANLNEKLNSGKYTILTAYQDKGDTQTRIYVLGKVKDE